MLRPNDNHCPQGSASPNVSNRCLARRHCTLKTLIDLQRTPGCQDGRHALGHDDLRANKGFLRFLNGLPAHGIQTGGFLGEVPQTSQVAAAMGEPAGNRDLPSLRTPSASQKFHSQKRKKVIGRRTDHPKGASAPSAGGGCTEALERAKEKWSASRYLWSTENALSR